MSRHYPQSLEEVWESFEWLLKDELRKIDHMTRKMFLAMQMARGSNEQIYAFIGQQFADLWEQVTAEEEQKSKYRRG